MPLFTSSSGVTHTIYKNLGIQQPKSYKQVTKSISKSTTTTTTATKK